MAMEKLCLRWNDFESNIGSAFRELREDKDLFDVTIACDDEEQIQAHKVILSACSPFFRKILRRNPHQHPLLYLKGVKYSDFQSVLNFMYHGEVNVAQEELNSFLAVAEDLRVKGLTQNKHESQTASSTIKTHPKAPDRDQKQPTRRPNPPTIIKPPPVVYQAKPASVIISEEIEEVVPIKAEPKESYHHQMSTTPINPTHVQEQSLTTYQEEEVDYEGYNQYEEENYEYTEADNTLAQDMQSNDRNVLQKYLRKDVTTTGSVFVCTICGKTNSQKNNVLNHVEGVHFPNNFVYSCQYCEKTMKTKNALYKHISQIHNQERSNSSTCT